MDFATSIKTCFGKYANFSGRASRSEFWYFMLFGFGMGIVSALVGGVVGLPLNLLVALALLLPNLAVGTRRLHDTNRSGWLQLLYLIPLIGLVVMIVFFVQRGAEEENRFGASPLPVAA